MGGSSLEAMLRAAAPILAVWRELAARAPGEPEDSGRSHLRENLLSLSTLGGHN